MTDLVKLKSVVTSPFTANFINLSLSSGQVGLFSSGLLF